VLVRRLLTSRRDLVRDDKGVMMKWKAELMKEMKKGM